MQHGIIVPGACSFCDFKKGFHMTGRSVRRNFMLGLKYNVYVDTELVPKRIAVNRKEKYKLCFYENQV